MINIVLTFVERRFYFSLFDNTQLLYKSSFEDASNNMTSAIERGLYNINIAIKDIQKVAFLTGPGSFTSIRLCIATVLAIQSVYPDKIYLPMTLDEMSYIKSVPIVTRCTKDLHHVFIDEWKLMNADQICNKTEKYTSDNDLKLNIEYLHLDQHCMHKHVAELALQHTKGSPIRPLYNFEIIRS